jgi:benzoyl-CoA reductase/2-hydroxyglutaryl-CoA dehydratase subunit BcrC/BadD/HgdB
MLHNFSQKYGVTDFLIDIPIDDDKSSIGYLVDQIKELIKTLEKKFLIKLDKKRLVEVIHNTKQVFGLLQKINDLYKNNSLPASLSRSLDYLMSYYGLLGSDKMITISERYYDELCKSISKESKKKIKPRILWHGFKPFYNDELTNYIENTCNIDIIHEYNVGYMNVSALYEIDDPYEFLAHKIMYFHKYSSIVNVWKAHPHVFKEYNIDGVISFLQWGCRNFLSVSQMMRDVLTTMDIPLLEIDGDLVDERNYSFSQIKIRIDAFNEMIQRRF